MLTSVLFFFFRLVQIVTTIPIWGMLAYFVDKYNKSSVAPPAEVLVLFITALIATIWALITLIQSKRFGAITMLTAVVDILIVGAFIAGIYLLRSVKDTDCVNTSVPVTVYYGDDSKSWGDSWGMNISKHCSMFKASWVLAIINCILFFLTALLAVHIYRRGDTAVAREKHHHSSTNHGRRRRRFY